MKYLWIFPYYLGWHYGRGTKETVIVFSDFFLFIPRFFSIVTLLKTLFSPFQRLKENYRGGFDIEAWASSIVVNIIMRLVGFVIRTSFIIIGLLATILTLILEIVLFLIWLALPVLLAIAFVTSLIALFSL